MSTKSRLVSTANMADYLVLSHARVASDRAGKANEYIKGLKLSVKEGVASESSARMTLQLAQDELKESLARIKKALAALEK